MRLLCLGDSLTYGYDVSLEKGWVSLAAAALRWEADNHGMCGDTTWGMLTRLRQLTLSGYDAFFLMGGSNDILEDIPLRGIEANMEAMIRLMQKQHKSIYLGIPPLTQRESADYGWQARQDVDRHNDMLADYRTWLLHLCQTEGLHPVDFYAVLQKSPHYADGVHPDETGYRLLADAAISVMKRADQTKNP